MIIRLQGVVPGFTRTGEPGEVVDRLPTDTEDLVQATFCGVTQMRIREVVLGIVGGLDAQGLLRRRRRSSITCSLTPAATWMTAAGGRVVALAAMIRDEKALTVVQRANLGLYDRLVWRLTLTRRVGEYRPHMSRPRGQGRVEVRLETAGIEMTEEEFGIGRTYHSGHRQSVSPPPT